MMAVIFWSLMCSVNGLKSLERLSHSIPAVALWNGCSYYHNTPQLTKMGHGDISTIVCPKHITKRGRGLCGGSEVKGAYCQAWWPEFNSRDPQDGSREVTPTIYPVTSICILGHLQVCAWAHTHTHVCMRRHTHKHKTSKQVSERRK